MSASGAQHSQPRGSSHSRPRRRTRDASRGPFEIQLIDDAADADRIPCRALRAEPEKAAAGAAGHTPRRDREPLDSRGRGRPSGLSDHSARHRRAGTRGRPRRRARKSRQDATPSAPRHLSDRPAGQHRPDAQGAAGGRARLFRAAGGCQRGGGRAAPGRQGEAGIRLPLRATERIHERQGWFRRDADCLQRGTHHECGAGHRHGAIRFRLPVRVGWAQFRSACDAYHRRRDQRHRRGRSGRARSLHVEAPQRFERADAFLPGDFTARRDSGGQGQTPDRTVAPFVRPDRRRHPEAVRSRAGAGHRRG